MDGLACCLFFCSFSLLSTLRSWWAVEKELFLDVSFSISCSIPSALYPTYYNNKNVCAWVTVMAKKIRILYLWPSSDFLRCSSNEMKTVHTGPGILIIDNAATHCSHLLDINPLSHPHHGWIYLLLSLNFKCRPPSLMAYHYIHWHRSAGSVLFS